MTKPDLAKRPDEVSAMFDRVSTRYDLMNDVLSGGITPYWRMRTRQALDPKPTERVLDVAAGTGTMSKIYAEFGADVTALDFSAGMIAEGKRRLGEDARIHFQQGDATQLPFDDASFDATTVSFGLRNVQEPKLALAEMFRVTKPGGRIVICEFSHPQNPVVSAGYDVYARHVMPMLSRLMSSDPEAYDYLMDSIRDWPDQPTLAAWLRETGFTEVAYRNLTFGVVALHRGTKPVETK